VHKTSCRSLFKQLEILPVPCQYILSLMNFIVNNEKKFQTNSSMHNISTRNKHHLHRPNANLYRFQKSTFYADIKIFNSLPRGLTILKKEKAKFKVTLRKYINTHSFYSVDEFLCVKMIYKMFIVFYTVKIVYICVFMTCSTSYCLCDTLMNSWNVCMYVCIGTFTLPMKLIMD
jgi:hypothetical protein